MMLARLYRDHGEYVDRFDRGWRNWSGAWLLAKDAEETRAEAKAAAVRWSLGPGTGQHHHRRRAAVARESLGAGGIQIGTELRCPWQRVSVRLPTADGRPAGD